METGRRRKTNQLRFGRILRDMPEVCAAPLRKLRPHYDQWFEQGRAFINETTTPIDGWVDFAESWDKIKFPGVDKLSAAFKAAEVVTRESGGDKLVLLANWCKQLQQDNGGQQFHLSGYDAGRLLEIGQKRACRWLQGLVAEGTLRLLKRGNRKLANEYRYMGGD